MGTKEKENLLNSLSKIYLKYYNPDEGYFKILRIIHRLRYQGIYIKISEVQKVAYSCDKEVK